MIIVNTLPAVGEHASDSVQGAHPSQGEVPPAEPVKDNIVAFARAVRGKQTYPLTAAHLVNNIALLEAVFKSALSGKIEDVA